MNVQDFECRSYKRARGLLGGKLRRAVCNNTSVVYYRIAVNTSVDQTPSIGVLLHGHMIVRHYQNGRTVLDSCGHRTSTIKDRINRCLPDGWKVKSVKDKWRLFNYHDIELGDMLEFVDGMTVPGTEQGDKQ